MACMPKAVRAFTPPRKLPLKKEPLAFGPKAVRAFTPPRKIHLRRRSPWHSGRRRYGRSRRPRNPPQAGAHSIRAEGGTGVHAALEDPPEEEAHGIRAEGGTGVHAAHCARAQAQVRRTRRIQIPTLFLNRAFPKSHGRLRNLYDFDTASLKFPKRGLS